MSEQATRPDVNLVRNTLFSFMSNGSNLLLLGLLLVAGRLLPVQDFGLVTYAMALGATLALLSDFGSTELVKRTVSREPGMGSVYLHNITTLKMVGAVIGIGIALIIALFNSDTETALLATVLIVAGSVMKSFKLFILGLFQANERFGFSSGAQIFHNVGLLTVCCATLLGGTGLIGFALGYFLFKLLDVLLAYALVHYKLYPFKFGWNLGFQFETQKIAIPFGAFIIVQEVYWYGDTLMLSYLKDMETVGYYNAAYRLLEGMIVFPNLICQAVLPHLSRLFHIDEDAHHRLSGTVQKICVAMALVLSGASFIMAPFVIEFVFGASYAQSIETFQILSLGFFFVFTNIYFLNLLISIDGQRLLWKLSFSGLIFNLIVNALVIPRWGAEGAAATTVLSEMLVLAIGLLLIAKTLPVMELVRPILKAMVIGAVLLVSIYTLVPDANVWINLLVYCVVVVPVISLSRLLSPKDIQEFARSK